MSTPTFLMPGASGKPSAPPRLRKQPDLFPLLQYHNEPTHRQRTHAAPSKMNRFQSPLRSSLLPSLALSISLRCNRVQASLEKIAPCVRGGVIVPFVRQPEPTRDLDITETLFITTDVSTACLCVEDAQKCSRETYASMTWPTASLCLFFTTKLMVSCSGSFLLDFRVGTFLFVTC